MDIKEVYEVYSKHIYYESTLLIDLPHAIYVTKECDSEPLWMTMLGPSSYGKTLFVRPFIGFSDEQQYNIVKLDTVTPKSFSKGKIGQQLQGKRTMILVPDLAGILTMEEKDRDQFFAQLRTVYDGYIKRDTGTDDCDYNGIRANFLGFSTPQIKRDLNTSNLMGTRDIQFLLPSYKHIELALEKNITEEGLKEIVNVCRKFIREKCNDRIFGEPNENMKEYLRKRATLISSLRVEGMFSVDGYLKEPVVPELPVRVYRQLVTLWKGLDHIGLSELGIKDTVNTIVRGTGNKVREQIFNTLDNCYYDEEEVEVPDTFVTKTRKELSEELNCDPKEVLSQLMVLRSMGMVKPFKKDNFNGGVYEQNATWVSTNEN